MANLSISRQNHEMLKEYGKKQLEMSADISNLTNKVSDLTTSNTRILYILEDDDKTGYLGLNNRSIKNTKRIDEHENKSKLMWGLGMFILLTFQALVNYFKDR